MDKGNIILIFHDETPGLELILQVLENSEYTFNVQWVKTEQAYLDALMGEPCDSIISAYELKSCNSLLACKAANIRCPNVQFVFISEPVEEVVVLEALEHGADHFLFIEHLLRLPLILQRGVSRSRALRNEMCNRELLENAMEQVVDSVEIANSQGMIRYVNSSYEKNTGHLKTNIIGKKSAIVNNVNATEVDLQGCWKTISKGEVWTGRVSNKGNGGTPVIEDVVVAPINDATGNIEYYVTVKRDVTEQVKLSNSLLRAQKMEAIGNLAGGIAHDFNNILSLIIGYSDMALEDTPVGNQLNGYLNEIKVASMRARELVKQILRIGRKEENDVRPVDVVAVVKEVVRLLKRTLPSTIEVKECLPQTSLPVLADQVQIYQIVMNICTNAYHAMKKTGGVLTISLNEKIFTGDEGKHFQGLEPGPHLKLTIDDTGEGMKKDVITKIYEPYFTTKDKLNGTGLGLSIVHGIVRQCGGTINVFSEVGKGSRFRIYLPRYKGLIIDQKNSQVSHNPGGNEVILLVDDEPQVLNMMELMLKRLGYRVLPFLDGFSALEALSEDSKEFDLVITDMTMPKMTGIEFIDKLRENNPEIPAVLCTGFNDQAGSELVKEKRIDGFFMKPVLRPKLASVIRTILDKKNKNQQQTGQTDIHEDCRDNRKVIYPDIS